MDESAKRVYELLPEAIEIEAAYMSCAQAVESCDVTVSELSKPIPSKPKQIPKLEKPQPYIGNSFSKESDNVIGVAYLANVVAAIIFVCVATTGDILAIILSIFLSFLWPILALFALFSGIPFGPAFFGMCLIVPTIVLIATAIYRTYQRNAFEKNERERVEKINADSIKKAETANEENQRLSDELDKSREKTLKALRGERVRLVENLRTVEGHRRAVQNELKLPDAYRNLSAMCGIYTLLNKRRALTLEGPDGAYAQYDLDQSLSRIENKLDRISSQVSELSDTVKTAVSRISSDLRNLERGLDGIRDATTQNAESLILKLDNNTRALKGISSQMDQQMEISNGIKSVAEYNAKVSNYENGWTSRPLVRYR